MSGKEKEGRRYWLWVLAVAFAVLSLVGPEIAGAADDSLDSQYLQFFDSDNQVAWAAPTVTWHCFDMAYYNGLDLQDVLPGEFPLGA